MSESDSERGVTVDNIDGHAPLHSLQAQISGGGTRLDPNGVTKESGNTGNGTSIRGKHELGLPKT